MNETTRSYGFGTTLDVPFAEAVERTKEALQAEGFGVLSTIDVQQTMKEKLDVDFESYVILGACSPQLAHRALQAEHELGLLLPCNVIVHEHDTPRQNMVVTGGSDWWPINAVDSAASAR